MIKFNEKWDKQMQLFNAQAIDQMQRLKMKQTEESEEFEANVMSQFVHKYKWSHDVTKLGHWEQKFFKS